MKPPVPVRYCPCQAVVAVLAFAILPWTAWSAAAGDALEVLTARVIRVRDGDSLLVRVAGKDMEVRLADVDAPERGQPDADAARKALIDLLGRRDVVVEVLDTDAYHRKVARVRRLPDRLDINAEVVRTGHAWVYRRYVRDESLFALEQAARDRRAGLWGLPEDQRIPPWEYRRLERR
jgi:endonuclease YncB( thermonuclease family)